MQILNPKEKDRKDQLKPKPKPNQSLSEEEQAKELITKLEENNKNEPVVIKNNPINPYQGLRNYIDHLNRQVEHVRDQVGIPNYTRTPIPSIDIPAGGMKVVRKVIKKKNTTFIYMVEQPVQENALHARRRILSLEIIPNEEKILPNTSTPNSTSRRKKSSGRKESGPSLTLSSVKSRKTASMKTVNRKKVGIKRGIRKTKTKTKPKKKGKTIHTRKHIKTKKRPKAKSQSKGTDRHKHENRKRRLR